MQLDIPDKIDISLLVWGSSAIGDECLVGHQQPVHKKIKTIKELLIKCTASSGSSTLTSGSFTG